MRAAEFALFTDCPLLLASPDRGCQAEKRATPAVSPRIHLRGRDISGGADATVRADGRSPTYGPLRDGTKELASRGMSSSRKSVGPVGPVGRLGNSVPVVPEGLCQELIIGDNAYGATR